MDQPSDLASPAPDQRDGRLRLIEAGEDLIGQHGPAGVSMRQIVSAAGHANPAAVQYHFGNLEGLIEAVYRLRLSQMERLRAELLVELDDDQRKDLAALLDVMMRPYLSVSNSKGQLAFARFVAQLGFSVENPAPWARSNDIAPVSVEIVDLIKAVMPPAPPRLQSARIVLVFQMLHRPISLASDKRIYGLNREELLDQAIAMGAAALKSAN